MNIEDKLIDFEKLAKSFKIHWSVCRFEHKKTFDVYVSKTLKWEQGFIVSDENLSKALDIAILRIHSLYSN